MLKIQIKLEETWQHFCYVSEELETKLDSVSGLTLNKLIRVWAKEDFGLTDIETLADLEVLRQRIKEKYRKLYPEIYLPSRTDTQGWTRVWFTIHFKEVFDNA